MTQLGADPPPPAGAIPRAGEIDSQSQAQGGLTASAALGPNTGTDAAPQIRPRRRTLLREAQGIDDNAGRSFELCVLPSSDHEISHDVL